MSTYNDSPAFPQVTGILVTFQLKHLCANPFKKDIPKHGSFPALVLMRLKSSLKLIKSMTRAQNPRQSSTAGHSQSVCLPVVFKSLKMTCLT